VKRFVVLACMLFAHAASADSTTADAKAARQHFDAGKKLIEKQKFDDGIREIEAAYDLDPQPLHIYNLGVAHHLRGDEQIAVEYYRLFLLDATPGKEARSATGYLTQLEKKLGDVRAEKTKKDIADAKAKATQGATHRGAEVMPYAQYIAGAEANERRVALLDEELKTADTQIAEAKKNADAARNDAKLAMTSAQRWERHARVAPSGEGRGRRIAGALLLGAGTGAVTIGLHDILSREPGVDVPDHANIFIGAGTGALLVGLAFVVWGESSASDPRPDSTFQGVQLTPTLGRDASGVTLSTRF